MSNKGPDYSYNSYDWNALSERLKLALGRKSFRSIAMTIGLSDSGLKRYFNDGTVPPIDKALDLLDTLNGLLGSPVLNGVTSGMSTDLPITPDAEIIIPGSVFCLTGKFITGTRKKCEDMVLSGGGQTSSSVTLKTDYLVIGDLSSRDWKFSSFGRKIEKAIEYRDSGKSDVSIISEKMWLDALKNFGVI